MRPLVVFSGGMDSALVLYRTLQEGDADTLYVEAGQHEKKIVAEKKAIARLIPKIEKYSSGGHRVQMQYERKVPSLADMPKMAFCQPLAWLFAALLVYDPREHSSIQIGYLLGDQVMTAREDLYRTWDQINRMSRHPPYVPIELPLGWMTKTRVMQELPWAIQRHTWTCEMPTSRGKGSIRPCGKCVPCATLQAEQLKFSIYHDMSVEEYHAQNPTPIPKRPKKVLTLGPDVTLSLKE